MSHQNGGRVQGQRHTGRKKIYLNPKGKIVKVLHFVKTEPHWRTWATESDGAIGGGSRVAKKECFHDHKTRCRLTARYWMFPWNSQWVFFFSFKKQNKTKNDGVQFALAACLWSWGLFWSAADAPSITALRRSEFSSPNIYKLPTPSWFGLGLYAHLSPPWWDFCLAWACADLSWYLSSRCFLSMEKLFPQSHLLPLALIIFLPPLLRKSLSLERRVVI